MPRNDYKLSKVPDAGITQDASLSAIWKSWFEDLYRMVGSENNYGIDNWTPTISGITGTASILNAKYFKFRKLLHFSLTIAPSSAVTSVSGTSIISALPKLSTSYGECHVFNTASRSLIGHGLIENNSNIIYLPSWLSITDNLSLSGFVFVDG